MLGQQVPVALAIGEIRAALTAGGHGDLPGWGRFHVSQCDDQAGHCNQHKRPVDLQKVLHENGPVLAQLIWLTCLLVRRKTDIGASGLIDDAPRLPRA